MHGHAFGTLPRRLTETTFTLSTEITENRS